MDRRGPSSAKNCYLVAAGVVYLFFGCSKARWVVRVEGGDFFNR